MQDKESIILSGLAVFVSFICYHAGINEAIFYALIIAIFIDLLSGVAKARKLGEEVTSSRFRTGLLTKGLMITVVLWVGFSIQSIVSFYFPDVLNKSAFIAAFIAYVFFGEFYSIISNMQCIKTGKPLSEWEAFSSLAKLIRDNIGKLLQKYLGGKK